MNRKLVSSIADLYFCPTVNNKNNVLKENITEGLFVTGNTVIDALKTTVPGGIISFHRGTELPAYGEKKIVYSYLPPPGKLQRRPQKNIMLALRQIAEQNREVELVYPVPQPGGREAVDSICAARPGAPY